MTDFIEHNIDELTNEPLTPLTPLHSNNFEQRDTEIMDERYFKCSMSSLFSHKFQKVMKAGGLQNISKSFSPSKNMEAILKSGESDGGAGGEFFLQTYDKKFFIKTINSSEEVVLQKIIDDYSQHFQENSQCFISKIIGYFIFDFQITGSNLKVIVLESVFKDHFDLVDRKYDIKGSKFQRRVLQPGNTQPNQRISKTLKDLDFLDIEKHIDLSPVLGTKIMKQLKNDVSFF